MIVYVNAILTVIITIIIFREYTTSAAEPLICVFILEYHFIRGTIGESCRQNEKKQRCTIFACFARCKLHQSTPHTDAKERTNRFKTVYC